MNACLCTSILSLVFFFCCRRTNELVFFPLVFISSCLCRLNFSVVLFWSKLNMRSCVKTKGFLTLSPPPSLPTGPIIVSRRVFTPVILWYCYRLGSKRPIKALWHLLILNARSLGVSCIHRVRNWLKERFWIKF